MSRDAKYSDGQKAQTIARERLAALSPADPRPASVVSPGPLSLPDTQGRRIALVIGNATYSAVSPLANARGDSALIAELLRRTGFETVNLLSDLNRERFLEALRAFAREAQQADWAVIYFAGHGIEFDGINYLIPIDAQLDTDRDAQFETVTLDQLLTAVEGARKLRLVILDACRNNPFFARMRPTAPGRSISRGLARSEPAAGTLVVYAAKHGQTALDGQGVIVPSSPL